MKTIWKYRLEATDEQQHQIPRDRQILHVGPDPNGDLCVWYMVDPESPKVAVSFRVFGTGHPIDVDVEEWSHLGSATCGQFVWHVFANSMS